METLNRPNETGPQSGLAAGVNWKPTARVKPEEMLMIELRGAIGFGKSFFVSASDPIDKNADQQLAGTRSRHV